jgi:hypothetical protein
MNYKKHIAKGFFLSVILIGIFCCRKTTTPGPQGPAGVSGNALLYKSGDISGTASGTNTSNVAFSVPFNLQYYSDVTDNSFYTDAKQTKYFNITRYDSLAESYINFMFTIDASGTVFTGNSITMKLVTPNTNKNFFYLGTGTSQTTPIAIPLNPYYTYNTSEVTINSGSYNSTTGVVSFDYTILLWMGHNTTGNMLTLTGSINATVLQESLRLAK